MRGEGICQKRSFWIGVGVALLLCWPPGAEAGRLAQVKTVANEVTTTRAAQSPSYRAALLVEPGTSTVLFEKNAHTLWPPASMVKMMTTLIILERVRDGSLALDEPVRVSRWAAQIGGSQVYLREGETFTVEELLKAVMVHSANDAAAALAEYVAGSTDAFVELMNAKARQLGLQETHYGSVHGLPPEPGHPRDLMSAHDLARLGYELMKFPRAAQWAAMVEEPFRGGEFMLSSPNWLLRQFPGADGIKTGFHKEAGYCVTATAKRKNLRLIAVVLGAPQRRECFRAASQLLTQGFANYRMLVPVKEGEALEQGAPIQGGVAEQVPVVATADVRVLVKRGQGKNLLVEIEVPNRVPAPIKAGQIVGNVVVKLDGAAIGKAQVAAAQDVQASLWRRWWPF